MPISRTPRGAFARRLPLVVALLCASLASFPPGPAYAALDINTADAATLADSLPGIGPVKAGRIVEYRRVHGPFADVDALIAVPGIGPKTLERIRRHLDDARSGASRAGDREGDYRNARAEPLSSAELEMRTRAAVRSLVDLAVEDAPRRSRRQ